MQIITIPHQSLRKKAQEIVKIDRKSMKFLEKLGSTLKNKDNPKGVGLAAPQVNKLWRVFVTLVSDIEDDDEGLYLRTFINPRIVKHSRNQTFGPDKKDPRLEGCLSMPGMYGPVPRWQWVEVESQTVDTSGDSPKLITQKGKFVDFHARVIQHEIDHLDGILFTDYSLQYDLPVYVEQGKKLVEIDDRSILESY